MSLVAKQDGGDFEIAPEGVHAARCYQVIDMGLMKSNFGKKHKVRIAFELDSRMSDGRPHSVSELLTVSLHEKSILYQRLISWRGRAFTSEELEGFDLKNVLGAPALINVIHNKSGDRTYANIASIMPCPKDQQPEPENEQLAWSYGDPTDRLPEWLRDRIGENPDRTYTEVQDDLADLEPIEDDDVPF